MKKTIIIVCMILGIANLAFAQGTETFSNFPETGSSYKDGTFTGQDGSTWTYNQCRGDVQITDETPCLGKDRTPTAEIYSGTISNGCGTLNFDYMQAFSSDVNLEVYVNTTLVATVTSSEEENVVKNSGDITVEIAGNFTLKFVQTNTSAGQVAIDNVTWTNHSSGAPDPEPSTHVTNFATETITYSSIELNWNNSTGGQLPDGYLIVAKTGSGTYPSVADGAQISDDLDWSDNSAAKNITFPDSSYTFTNLTGETAYDFMIYPYTNFGADIDYKTDGTIPSTSGTTLVAPTVIESENFDSGDFGNWSTYSVASNNNWTASGNVAEANGYGGDVASDDWLISPALNLDLYTGETLTFISWTQYTDTISGLEVKLSTDYSGGDPTSATWQDLNPTLPAQDSQTWTESGDVDISGFSGANIYIAFRYQSTGTGGGSSTLWKIDDIEIAGYTSGGASAPIATTNSASDITQTSVTLNGVANPNNAETTVIFQYGLTDSYGDSILANESPLSGSNNQSVTGNITGLDPNTTYHFRVRAENSEGVTYGDDLTFTTLVQPSAPTAITDSASAITHNSASIYGTVKPNNAETTVKFAYGTTTAYGDTVTATQSPITGSSETLVSADITGLSADTEYHFLVIAENSEGIAYGNDSTFTTTSAPDVPNLIISEIADPGDNYQGRFVELYNTDSAPIDLTNYSLKLYFNGSSTPSAEISLSGILDTSSTYVIGNDANMQSFYGVSADLDFTINANGNDVIALYQNTTLIDILGEIGVDGSGENWEYTDSQALRNIDITTPNATWTASEWTITAANVADMTPGTHGEAPPPPNTHVQFTATSATASEGDGTVDLTISISNPDSNSATAVDVVLISGDSTDIDNYTTQTVIFPADNSNNQTVTINITDDSEIEGNEIFTFELQNVTGGNNAEIGVQNSFELTIEDNDTPESDLVINEIHADPDVSNGDANGDGTVHYEEDEFVEIVNSGSSEIDISNWTLSDGVDVRHTFAENTNLPAGGAIVIFGGGTPTGEFGGSIVDTASSGILGLNNSGDDVIMKNDSGVTIVSYTYGSEGSNNQSITRYPDITGDFVSHSTATGSEGELFSPGTKINGDPFILLPTNTKVMFASTSATATEGDGSYTLIISISDPDSNTATTADVVLTNGDAADIGNYTTQSITFPANSSADQTVEITITDDDEVEDDELFTFKLQNISGGDSASVGVPDSFNLTLKDNDYGHTILFPGLTGEELIDSLVTNYKPSSVLGYDSAREKLYTEIDNHNDSLSCVYTGLTIYLDNESSDPIGDASDGNINCEHTWPQSKGASEGTNAHNDMHHLYPTRGNANSARSNNPFAEIPDDETDYWYRLNQRVETPMTQYIDEYSEEDYFVRFEPREDHKGNAARSCFYFYTMYQAQADAADPTFFEIQKDVLLSWHRADIPDQNEFIRNEDIAQYQTDKTNPFIVDTTLVARAYFAETIPEPEISLDTTSVSSEVTYGENGTAQFTIYNTGVGVLYVQITSDSIWLTSDIDSDEIQPADSLIVTLTMDSQITSVGTHSGQVIIINNDEDENPTYVDVNFMVNPVPQPPEIQVSPTDLSDEVAMGENGSAQFKIKNLGDEDLFVGIWEDSDWIIASADTDTIYGSDSLMVDLTLDSQIAGVGTHSDTIKILSNDADEDTTLVMVNFVVLDTTTHNIVINEIFQNPDKVGDSDGEWFELYNTETDTVDLNGWTVKDAGSDIFVIDTSLEIAPHSYLVLGKNPDTATNGGVTIDYEYPGDFYLGNGEDELILLDHLDREIDRVEYDGSGLFPDPTGKSMELINPTLDNSNGENWGIAQTQWSDGSDYGTPGELNSIFIDGAVMQYSPTDSLNFGNVVLGMTDTLAVTIKNVGIDTLDVQSSISGDSEFSVLGDTTYSVAVGDSQTINIEFAPQDTGSFVDELMLETNESGNPQYTIQLNGIGKGIPQIQIEADSLVFGEILLGEQDTLWLKYSNIGTAALEVSADIGSRKREALPFDAEDGIFTLEPGESDSLWVNFAPQETGLVASILNLETNEPNSYPILLKGTGIAAFIATQPDSVYFGNVRVDSTKTMDVEIENIGNAPLEITDIITEDNFSVSQTSFTIQPNHTDIVEISFNPTTEQVYHSELFIQSNAFDNDNLRIPLFGEGVIPNISVTIDTLKFGYIVVNNSSTESFTINNTGSDTLHVNDINLSLSEYNVLSDTVFAIPPEDSADVMVEFTPSAVIEFVDSLVVNSDDPDQNEITLILVGNGRLDTFNYDMLKAILNSWGMEDGYDPVYDLDNDGKITIKDIQYYIHNSK